MNCPNCESDNTIVTETRLASNNGIGRVRVCKTCTARFTTLEVPAEVSIAQERRKFVRKTPRHDHTINLNTLWEIWKC